MEDQAKYLELALTSLVNAGRWEEAERFASLHPDSHESAHIALAFGSALAHLDKWERASEVFGKAHEREPENAALKEKLVESLLHKVNLHLMNREWENMDCALTRLVSVDPEHPEVKRLQFTLAGAGAMTQLVRGKREELAKEWECQLAEERRPETAHCLAILYYWSAVFATENRHAAAPFIWQKAIACWSFALHHPDYLPAWRAQKERTYPIEESVLPQIVDLVRRDIMDRIDTAEAVGDESFVRYAEDLRRDLWMEWETAAVIVKGGGQSPSGPLLLSLLGAPEKLYTSDESFGKKGLILGNVELPFLESVDHLLNLCVHGYSRVISYLADDELDHAETLLNELPKNDPDSASAGMKAFMLTRRVQQKYVNLPCPSTKCSFDEMTEYADKIHALLNQLKEIDLSETPQGVRKMIEELVVLFCRRTRNEFENFETELHLRSLFTEAGTSIIEKSLLVHNAPEGKQELALMFNRLALQQDKNLYDLMVQLFERANELAPEHPLYRRNLAFSYFNRYQKRRFFDVEGAAEDIAKAYQLEPYDEDIRTANVQMRGRR